MNAEFALLVYHQLILLSDMEDAPLPPRGRDTPVVFPQAHRPENYNAPCVTPKDNRPADTEKTMYRWNHVKDSEWVTWGYGAKRNWSDHMIKKYGKAIVW